jgi:hypothetical protein
MWSGEHTRYRATRLTALQTKWMRIASFVWWLWFEFRKRGVQWFCKMCSADPKESATGSQVIRSCISVMASWNFTYSLNVINNLFQIIAIFFLIDHQFISYDCCSTYLRTSCTHYASYTHFNQGHIMQCLVMCANDMYSCLFKIIPEW